MADRRPSRGDIWMMDFNPTRGHEQSGIRPALVISVDPFNHGPADFVIVVPLTTKDKRIRSHVQVNPPEGGLTERSFLMAEAVRSVSQGRLMRRLGAVEPSTLSAVEDGLKILLGLR